MPFCPHVRRRLIRTASARRQSQQHRPADNPAAVFTLTLSDRDADTLRRLANLGTNISNTFLTYNVSLTQDTSALALPAAPSAQAVQASAVVPDTTSPQLLSYTFNALNGSLVLSFSETVNVASLQPSELTFVSSASAPQSFYALLNSTVTTAVDSTSVEIVLSSFDQDSLKSQLIATQPSNTFLSASAPFAKDLSGNQFTAIATSSPLQATSFVRDTVKPTLTSWDLNINDGLMSLTFSEPIDTTSINLNSLQLQNRATEDVIFRLTSSAVSSTNSNSFVVQLSSADLNAIKSLSSLSKGVGSSYLSANGSLVSDTSKNSLTVIPSSSAQRASAFVADMQTPSLLSYSLKLTSGALPLVLELNFSEPMNASSLDLSQISLHNALRFADSTISFSLSSSQPNAGNTALVRVEISDTDTAAIRQLSPLFVNRTAFFLSMSSRTMSDMAGLFAVPTPIGVAPTVHDTFELDQPSLTSASIDFLTQTMRLTFSEEVRTDFLDASKLTIQNSSSSSVNSYTFTTGSVNRVNATTISVNFADDMSQLERIAGLAEGLSSTFISLQTGLGHDVYRNPSLPVAASNALQVSSYTSNPNPPELVGFVLNLNGGQPLQLRFSKAINHGFNASHVFLQNTHSQPTTTFRLTGGLVNNTGSSVNIYLSSTDRDSIKKLRGIATSVADTYVALPAGAVSDLSSQPLAEIKTSDAFRAISVIPDSEPPRLESFTINMRNGGIVLQFDETVSVSSFTATAFTLQDAKPQQSVWYTLTDTATTSTADDFRMTVQLSYTDLNAVKGLGLCRTVDNCFLRAAAGGVTDIFAQPLSAIIDSDALRPSNFTADDIRPVLVSFTVFDLGLGHFSLSFSETVNVSTFVASEVTFHSYHSIPDTNYTLTGGIVLGGNSPNLTVELTLNDSTQVRRNAYLCTTRGNCYIELRANAVRDSSDFSLLALPRPIPVATFIHDRVEPRLTNFRLDMVNGHLVMTFDEAISSASIETTLLSLQDAANATASYSLTSGTTLTGETNSHLITLALSTSDFAAIQSLSFAKSTSNTYISLLRGFATDLAGVPNQNRPIPSTDSLQATSYIADQTAPELTSFALDMDADQLLLTFSEPVRSSQLSAGEITLIGSNGATYRLTGGSTQESGDGHSTLTVNLLPTDLTFLKTNDSIADSLASTSLSATSRLVSDNSGNALQPPSAKQASAFTPDTSSPALSSYTFDVHRGWLNLTFNDVVKASTFRPEEITLQASALGDPAVRYTLTSHSQVVTSDGYAVRVRLNSDLFGLKSVRGLALKRDSAYLLMRGHAIDDPFGTDNVPITDGKAIQPTIFIADTFRPELTRASLDWNRGVLNLTLSDAVDPQSIILSEITLQNNASASTSYSLTGGATTLYNEGTLLVIDLLEVDLNNIKANEQLVYDANGESAFVSVSSRALADTAGNPVIAVADGSARAVDSFIPDTTRPTLRSYLLNMNTGELVMTWSETVQSARLVATYITLQSVSNTSYAHESVTLRGGVVSQSHAPVVTIALTRNDLDQIRVRTQLATSVHSTYLSVLDSAAHDMRDLGSEAISSAAALRASTFVTDSTKPLLTSFHADLNNGSLLLTFSEAVDASTFTVSRISFLEASSRSNHTYQLTTSSLRATTDGSLIVVDLSRDDLNAIKLRTQLATSSSNTFMSFDESLVSDMAGNSVQAESARQTTMFTPDATSPLPLSFSLDLNTGVLLVEMDETISASTVNVSAFTLLASAGSATDSSVYRLTDSNVSLTDSTTVTIALSRTDLDSVKLRTSLATSDVSTHLRVDPLAFTDMNGNNNNLLQLQSPQFVADTSSPSLSEFRVDMNSSLLTLSFNEAVNASTLQVDGVSLYRRANATAQSVSHTLGAGSSVVSGNGDSITIRLGQTDFNALQAQPLLFTSLSDSFVQLRAASVADMASNDIRASSTGLGASQFDRDVHAPLLLLWSIDMTSGVLTVSFSETMNVSSLALNQLVLQSKSSTPSSSLTDLFGTYSAQPAAQLSIVFDQDSLNSLKAIEDLVSDRTSSYLSIPSTAISDMSGNAVVGIARTAALQADSFVSDRLSPNLLHADVDLHANRLRLFFDESIRVSSFANRFFTFRSDNSTNATTYTLQNSTASDINMTVLEVFISKTDIDALNALDFCTSALDCFVSFGEGFLTDNAGNNVTAVPSNEAVQTRQFTVDSANPSLVIFTELDKDEGTLTIEFSETMNASSVRPEQLVLQNWYTTGATVLYQLPLTGGTVLTRNDKHVKIQLVYSDLNTLKNHAVVCRSTTSCFIRFPSTFAEDVAGNPTIAVTNTATLQDHEHPSTLVEDTTPARLLSFNFSSETGKLDLLFDEIINVGRVTTSAFTFLSDPMATAAVTLGSSTVLSTSNSDRISISLSTADLIQLKANSIALTANTTFLSLSSSAAQDTSGNGVEAITATNAKPVSSFDGDRTSPSVLAFNQFDMNRGRMAILFDEPVLLSSFVFNSITLQSSASGSGPSISLAGGSAAYSSSDKREVTITLLDEDMRLIKLEPALATQQTNTFLSLTSRAVTDLVDLPVNATPPTQALPAQGYIPDTTFPSLLSFSLDLDAGLLNMTFDDVIDATQVEPDKISIQSSPRTSTAETRVNLTSGTTLTPNGYEVALLLSGTDLDAIKARDLIATSVSNTFLTMTPEAIADVAGQHVQDVAVGFQASNVTEDTTRPQLTAFSVNLDRAVLRLTFSEVIFASGFEPIHVQLQDSALFSQAMHSYNLTGGVKQPNTTATVLELHLTRYDADNIKQLTNLATAVNNSFLAISSQAVSDMNANALVAISSESALRAHTFGFDVTIPRLTAFSLDINHGILELTFSEAINATSLIPTSIRLQNASTLHPASSVSLTGGTVATAYARAAFQPIPVTEGDDVALVSVTAADLNAIKAIESLATSPLDTYISFGLGMVSDLSKNRIAALPSTNALMASRVIPDIVRPQLVSFDLDMDTAVVTLRFSETVQALSFNPSQMTLSSSSSPSAESFTLQSSVVTSMNGPVVTLPLSFDDANAIRLLTTLGVSANTTLLTFTSGLVDDTNNNSVIAVVLHRASSFVKDTTKPTLTCFSLDMDAGYGSLQLTFSEAINVSSLLVRSISIQSSANSSVTSVTLATSTTASNNSHIIDIDLSYDDANSIKALPGLASSENTTFLSALNTAISDMQGNSLVPVMPTATLKACSFVRDTSPPTLTRFELRMTNRRLPLILVLQFSETVNTSTLALDRFSFQSTSTSSDAASQSYTLTTGNFTPGVYKNEFSVIIDDVDLIAIKALTPLLQTRNASFLFVAAGGVFDMVGLPLSAIASTNALPVSTYTADLSTPLLLSFTLDMDADQLTLSWHETVIESTFVVNRLSLQSAANNTGSVYQLTSGTAKSLSQSVVLVNLTRTDVDAMKRLPELVVSRETTFISLVRGLLLDQADNPSLQIATTDAQQAAVFIPDTTEPRLQSWNFTTDTQVLVLSFSETVNASALHTAGLTLHSSPAMSAISYTLTGGSTQSVNNDIISISLSDFDVNELKKRPQLLTSVGSSYISTTPETIKDMFSNRLETIAPSTALLATSVSPDTIHPDLIDWRLDLDNGEIVLSFDETVNVTSLNVAELSLRASAINDTVSYALTTSLTSNPSQPQITLQLSTHDLNEIKRLSLCHDKSDCFLSISADAVRDMVGLTVVPRENVAVQTFSEDITSPVLDGFAEFNLMAGSFTLRFSEVVQASSFNISAISLQTFFSNPISRLRLSGGRHSQIDSTTITVWPSSQDTATIKASPHLCSRRGTCYITFDSTLVNDMNNNSVIAVSDGPPGQVVEAFTIDNQSPYLVSFDLDMTIPQLSLTFNEPVRVSSLDISALTLQLDQNSTQSFSLTSASSSLSADGVTVDISIGASDLNSLKLHDIGSSPQSTYLSMTSAVITDMAFNARPVIAVPAENATLVTNLVQDTTIPRLVSTQFSLSTDELVLSFNEPVRKDSLRTSFITLYSKNSSSSAVSHSLSGGSLIASDTLPGANSLTVRLLANDLEVIKLHRQLATEKSNIFFSANASLAKDMAGNDLAAVAFRSVDQFVVDSTRATLSSFSLDMNIGQLNLTFSDVMRADSFDASAITIQSAQTAVPPRLYTLSKTGSSISSGDGGYVFVVSLAPTDFFNIKSISGLANTQAHTYLTMQAFAVNDHADIDILAITDGHALRAAQYTPDYERPLLSSWSFDLDNGEVALDFSDTVSTTTVNQGEVLLQGASVLESTVFNGSANVTVTAASLRVSGAQVSQRVDKTAIVITLSDDQLNAIKVDRDLCSSPANCFVSLSNSTVADIAGNDVHTVHPHIAQQVSLLTNDTTSPRLTRWNLNMNESILEIVFSESVDLATVDATGITIQNIANATGTQTESVTLSGGMALGTNGITLRLRLTPFDTNSLKSLDNLATSRHNSYIALNNDIIHDMSGNLVSSIATSSAWRVALFTPDTINPRLLSYNLDLDKGLIIMTFSETMAVNSFDSTGLQLQSQSDATGARLLPLSGGNVSRSLAVAHLPAFKLGLLQSPTSARSCHRQEQHLPVAECFHDERCKRQCSRSHSSIAGQAGRQRDCRHDSPDTRLFLIQCNNCSLAADILGGNSHIILPT